MATDWARDRLTSMTQSDREQPWRDDEVRRPRIVVLSENPISQAITTIARAVGHEVVVISDDDGGPGLSGPAPRAGDAVVLCDHDAPDAPAVCERHSPPRRRTSP